MNKYIYKCELCGKEFDLYKGEGWGESYNAGGILPKTRYVCMKCIESRKKGTIMTHEQIAEQLYDELQHNRITNYQEYSKRLYELLDLAHPDEDKVGDYVQEVEDIMHDKWSFGFCDMCGEYINYDEDTWYDLAMVEPEEQEILKETYPIYKEQVGHDIQDVCTSCWHKLLRKED